MRIGVDDQAVAQTDGYVAFPEDQVATSEGIRRDGRSQLLLLIRIPRAGAAASKQGLLDKPGTIQPQTLAAAPQIGSPKETLGHSRPVVFAHANGLKVVSGHPAGARNLGQTTLDSLDGHQCIDRIGAR